MSSAPLGVRDSLRLGVACVLAAMLVVGLGTFGLWTAAQRDFDAAAAVADGRVVGAGGDDGLDVTVAWSDRAGVERRDDFYVYEEEDARVGAPFPVRYDPSDPDGETFVGGPDLATGPGEDAMFTGLAGVGVGLLFLLAWGVRLRRNRRAAVAVAGCSGRPMSMLVMHGASNGASKAFAVLVPHDEPVPSPRSELEELLAARHADEPGDEEELDEELLEDRLKHRLHQPVVYEPILDEVAGDVTPVLVHVESAARGRRAVVELATGYRLTPAGRLLKRRPRSWTVLPRSSVVDRLHEELRTRARAGDAEARERLAVLLREVKDEAASDPLSVPVPERPVRSLQRAFSRRLWVLLPGAFLGYTSAGVVGVLIAVPCFALMNVAFWSWYGADVE